MRVFSEPFARLHTRQERNSEVNLICASFMPKIVMERGVTRPLKCAAFKSLPLTSK